MRQMQKNVKKNKNKKDKSAENFKNIIILNFYCRNIYIDAYNCNV